MKRLLILLVVVVPLLSGCSISLSNSKVKDGGVFRSRDYGEHWEQKVFVGKVKNRSVTISDVDVTGMVQSPFSQDELTLTTAANGVYVTADGGETWKATTLTTGNYPTFAYDPSNPVIQYTASGRNIFKSADSGGSWNVVYTDARGESITAVAVDRYDTGKVYAGTNGGTIVKSVNFGNDWSVKHTAGDPIRSIFFRGDDTRFVYIVTTNKGIERSDDGGETWTSLVPTLAKFPGAQTVYEVTFSPNAPLTLYMATNYGVLKSIDGGDTWEGLKTLIPPNTLPVRTLGVDPNNSQVLYFTVNNLLHKTEDGGQTWRTIENIGTSRLIARMLVSPTAPGTIYLGTFRVKK